MNHERFNLIGTKAIHYLSILCQYFIYSINHKNTNYIFHSIIDHSIFIIPYLIFMKRGKAINLLAWKAEFNSSQTFNALENNIETNNLSKKEGKKE